MTHPITRAGGWLLNRLPPWLARWAPDPVLHEAIAQLRLEERRSIALARADLVIREIRQEIEELRP